MTKVLVVEDVEIARKIMGIMLQKVDCSVDMAKNGLEALKLFFTNKYDLIFMDLGLPDISGVTITKLIRNYENKETPVPVVALTAHVDDNHKQECFAAGMNGFLVKPIATQEFQDTINTFIGAKVSSHLNC